VRSEILASGVEIAELRGVIDATEIDAAGAKLLSVERRSLRGDPQRPSEARPAHRLQRGPGNEPQQFDRALRARSERQQFGEFDDRRQHLSASSHPARRASSNELLQELDAEIDLLL